MSGYYIYLKVEDYLKCFLEHNFGDPVQLIKDSPEARIVRQYVIKTPEGVNPDNHLSGNLKVELPWFKAADPRVRNYLGKRAKKLLIDSFQHIFKACMLKEIGALENTRRGEISKHIYAWMEKHGIPEDNWYTVSQKYYRLRKQYLVENNVKV